tara:strand:- start:2243 stop:3874 length:1632 start_codon:yes stop_codon:yes gene_type:complete
MKNLFFRNISLFFISLFIISCQKDDTISPQAGIDFSENHLQHKYVNADDIPEVMEFLRRSGPQDFKYEIQTGSLPGEQTRSGEPDLVLSDLVTSQIMAITNEANLTNYSFQLEIENAPVYEGEISFFNLIVKETTAQEGYYAYIQEYRMDENWYNISEQDFDFGTYVGKIVIYTIEGLFVFSVEVNEGDFNHAHYKSPCPPNTGGGSGSGGSSNPPGGGSTGGTGGTGGGGPIVTIDYICGCEPGHIGGNSNPNCDCPLANIPIGIIISERTIEGIILNELRNPCPPLIDLPPDCNQPNGEPCLFGCNTDGSCIDENPNVGINLFKPHQDCAILNQIAEHQQTISKIEQLQTQLNNQFESGFNLFKSSQGNVNSTNIDSGNYVTFPFSSNPVVFGGVHLHHNNGFPMFSLQDVLTLNQFYNNFANNGDPPDKTNPTLIMVSSLGVYAIKIEYLQAYQNFVNELSDIEKFNDFHNNLEKEYYKLFNPVNGQIASDFQYHKTFLKFFIEENNTGISLYKMNQDLTGWNRIILNENGSPVFTFSCN